LRESRKINHNQILPSVDIYVATHNDELYVDHFCKWYKNRFPGAKIYFYDNYSTDRTREKAVENGCSVESFGNPAFHDENALTALKNNCFKDGTSDYFIICDVDELLALTAKDLAKTSPTFVQGRGWQMINVDNSDFESIALGVREIIYDKYLCFQRQSVTEINYSNGAHKCSPVISATAKKVRLIRCNLFHFRWLSLNHVLKRFHDRSLRVKLNSENYSVLKKWHYDISENELKSEHEEMVRRATAVRVVWEKSELDVVERTYYSREIFFFLVKSIMKGYFLKSFRLLRHESFVTLVETKRRFFSNPWF
jgi:hypothetical protein